MTTARLLYYTRIWKAYTLRSMAVSFASRFGALFFIVGKIVRFAFFVLTILVLMTHTKALVGYSTDQVLVFMLTFFVIDTASQFFFREVYRFRAKVLSGSFDFDLLRPMRPLFTPLLGGADGLDAAVLVVFVVALLSVLFRLHIPFVSLVLYTFFIINAFIVSTALHVIVLAFGILVHEVEGFIMVVRDVATMVRLPVDIYQEPLRSLLTFIIPVGIMMSFPPKVLFGTLTLPLAVIGVLVSLNFLVWSLVLWKVALKRYASASS